MNAIPTFAYICVIILVYEVLLYVVQKIYHAISSSSYVSCDHRAVIAIDFDGTIHRYSKGWCSGKIYDFPERGVARAIRRLREAKYKVVIHSPRAVGRSYEGKWQESQRAEMRDWLELYGIEYDEITATKPEAFAYIDDKAIRYNGDWNAILNDLLIHE